MKEFDIRSFLSQKKAVKKRIAKANAKAYAKAVAIAKNSDEKQNAKNRYWF